MKQNECGRSMVEMLGVLAIIGVLSVGGIMGYTTAMRKHRANEIVALITQMAMYGHTLRLQGDTTTRSYQYLTGESLPTELGLVGLAVVPTASPYVSVSVKNSDVCHAVESHFSSDSTQQLWIPAEWRCDVYCTDTRPNSYHTSECPFATTVVIRFKP